MKTKFSHYTVWFGITTCCLVATGCVGRKGAVGVVGRMETASILAENTATALKASDEANVAALREAWTAFVATQRSLAERKLELTYATFERKLNLEEANALYSVLGLRDAAIGTMETEFLKGIESLLTAERAAADEAKRLQEEAKRYSNDLDRREKMLRAVAAYLAIGATRAETEGNLKIRAYRELDSVVSAVSATIKETGTTAREEGSRQLTKAKDDLQAAANRASVPSLPSANTGAFTALIEYTKAVKSGSTAFKDYLAANSMARDSFLGTFAKHFTAGLLPGLDAAAKGETVKTADVLDAARTTATALLDETTSEIEDQLDDLLQGFNESTSKVGTEVSTRARERARDIVQSMLDKILPSSPPQASDAIPAAGSSQPSIPPA